MTTKGICLIDTFISIYVKKSKILTSNTEFYFFFIEHIYQLQFAAEVAQWVIGFAPQAKGCEFESQPP